MVEMTRRTKRGTIIVASMLVLASAVPVLGAREEVELGGAEVVLHEPGDYYTVQLPVPRVPAGKALTGAYLEFYVDVEGASDAVNETPVLEVYALEGELRGGSYQAELGKAAFGPRNVAIGLKRRVVVDVSEIVRGYLGDASKNHGLIISKLTGVRDGAFTLRDDVLGKGVAAKVTFYYR
jgi:hypothetical protein